MAFGVKDTLTQQELESGLKQVIRSGIAAESMVTLTGGAFLVAFALKLGASNIVIGLLAAIAPLAQLLQIPSILLVQKLRNRRAITVTAAGLSRLPWLFIALIPFLFPLEKALPLLLGAMIVNAAFGAVSNASWNSWMRDLVPQERLGSFFSKRMRLAIGSAIMLSLSAAVFIDLWKKHFSGYELQGYSILFFGGFAAGVVGVFFLSRIPEPRMVPMEAGVFRSLLEPFRDANFRNLIRFSGPWSFAVNLAAPFFTVYMLRRLNFGLSSIVGLTVLSQVMNFSFLRIWGRLSDRFSNKSVLTVSGPLFMLCILAWTFTTMPGRHPLTVPLLICIHVFMGIAMAGVTLTSGNIGLKLAPRGQATAYLAAHNLINSLAAGSGPILGGRFADFFAKRELSWTLTWKSPDGQFSLPTFDLRHWDFFFVFAFVVGLYSIHRLAAVREVGEAKENMVVQELLSETRRGMRNLSTVGGLRHMLYIPVLVYRQLTRKQRSLVQNSGETPPDEHSPPDLSG